MEKMIATETNSSIQAKYNACYDRTLAIKSELKKPMALHIVFGCIYAAIIVCAMLYGYHYSSNRYDQWAAIFPATMFALAGGLVLCGVCSLMHKCLHYLATKPKQTLLDELLSQQEEMLQLKDFLIDHMERSKEKPLVRPYDNCANPLKLQRQWKEQERILYNLELLELESQFNYNSPKTLRWILAAIAVAVGSIFFVIAVSLLVAVVMLRILFVMLHIHFTRNDDSRMYQSSRPTFSSYPQHERVSTPVKTIFDKENTSKRIRSSREEAKSKISNIKKDLKLWGYMIPRI